MAKKDVEKVVKSTTKKVDEKKATVKKAATKTAKKVESKVDAVDKATTEKVETAKKDVKEVAVKAEKKIDEVDKKVTAKAEEVKAEAKKDLAEVETKVSEVEKQAKAKIDEELPKVKQEAEKVETEVKQEAKVLEEKSEDITKKYPWLLPALVVIIVILVILLLTKGTGNTNSSRTEYKLSEVYETYFADNDGSVTLPKGWMVDKAGSVYVSDNGVLTARAFIMAIELDEEDYNSYMESYGSYYDMHDYEGYKYTAKYFSDDSTGYNYDVYFIYNEGLVTQVMFIDAEEADEKTVLNSLSLPAALETSEAE